jgi:transcriptional regulator with XRE-family HTH domain
MDAQARLARNLRRIRNEKSLTQEELAHKAGIHQTYLSGMESGKRNPSIALLGRVADALGVDIQLLFER